MIADRCDPTDPRLACGGRHDAGLRNEFRFSFQDKGWVWRAMEDDHRVKFRVCPFCNSPLPNLWAVYARLKQGIYEDAE